VVGGRGGNPETRRQIDKQNGDSVRIVRALHCMTCRGIQCKVSSYMLKGMDSAVAAARANKSPMQVSQQFGHLHHRHTFHSVSVYFGPPPAGRPFRYGKPPPEVLAAL